jgi:hypothetical protein
MILLVLSIIIILVPIIYVCLIAIPSTIIIFPSIVVCLLVYWILIRSTKQLLHAIRRKVILAYVVLHVGSWVTMHVLAAVHFRDQVHLMHQRAVTHEIEEYHESEKNPDPDFEKDYLDRLNSSKPWYRTLSVAPLPFLLITTEEYKIGLFGLGEFRIYTLMPFSLKLLDEGIVWIS